MVEKERSDRFKAGIEVRTKVLGEEYINAIFSVADEFIDPVQELATEWAWGSVWTRPGLSLRDRSLLEIGILTALNSTAELRTHLVGGIRNGLTEIEIREALLQTAAHCGFPSTVAAYKVARNVLRNFDENLAPKVSELGWGDASEQPDPAGG